MSTSPTNTAGSRWVDQSHDRSPRDVATALDHGGVALDHGGVALARPCRDTFLLLYPTGTSRAGRSISSSGRMARSSRGLLPRCIPTGRLYSVLHLFCIWASAVLLVITYELSCSALVSCLLISEQVHLNQMSVIQSKASSKPVKILCLR